MADQLMTIYRSQLEAIYEGNPWLGETFAGKLDGITENEAFSKPVPHIHSIAEIMGHLIVWRKEILHRLKTGDEPRLSMQSRENWRSNEILLDMGWKKLRTEFEQFQQKLLKFLEHQSDNFLEQSYLEKYTMQYFVEGLIHHDLYHLGQIGLIFKMITKYE